MQTPRDPMNIQIRPETPADIASIDAVTVAAFLEAPHTDHTEQFIVAALRRSSQLTVSLVAEQSGAIVGHVAASPVTIAGADIGWYGLGPVSVLPHLQGKGIGTQLIDAALEQLRVLGAGGCVVLGDPGYYERFGFKATDALTLPGVPAEYFQALSFGMRMPQGAVAYHASFSAQE